MPPKVDGFYVHGPECDCDWCEEDLQLMRTGRIRSEAQVQAEGQTPVRGRRGRVVNIRGPKKGGTGDARLARYYGVSADRLIRHLADDIPAA
jgi:hypothetical protein